MLSVREANRSIDEFVKKLEAALIANQFGKRGVHDFRQKANQLANGGANHQTP